MEFNWLNKKKYGIVTTLLLVILLSQSKIFDFLFVTPLGRAILILFILGISYTSKNLGLFVVFLIIIMFNYNSIRFLEGYSLNSLTSENAINALMNKKQTPNLNIPGSNYPTNILSSKETFVGQEGFNIIDRENTILRGKNSNQISVSSSSRIPLDTIEPTDNLIFSSISSRF